jgi:uncharacterized membrane protein
MRVARWALWSIVVYGALTLINTWLIPHSLRLGAVLVGDGRRNTSLFTPFAAPFITAFAMVAWDVCLDPTFSTILTFWIWEPGSGYFGVPLANYRRWRRSSRC